MTKTTAAAQTPLCVAVHFGVNLQSAVMVIQGIAELVNEESAENDCA